MGMNSQLQCKQVEVLPSKNQALHKLNYCKSTTVAIDIQ